MDQPVAFRMARRGLLDRMDQLKLHQSFGGKTEGYLLYKHERHIAPFEDQSALGSRDSSSTIALMEAVDADLRNRCVREESRKCVCTRSFYRDNANFIPNRSRGSNRPDDE
jgi:hypothetical protein